MLKNDAITEVMVNGPNLVFAEFKGRVRETDAVFENDEHVVRVINRILQPLGRRVDRFEGDDGEVTGVVLDDGTRLDAHLVVLGVGVRAGTGFLDSAVKHDDGGVLVDDHLRVEECGDLFAAGDVATFPDARDGRRVRIEHWRVAGQQGRVAALNMLDRDEV